MRIFRPLLTRSQLAIMQPLITVVGATGTGKSKLAVDIAKRFNGEVINGDAMQLYRGLPIITNKIPLHEREGIPHHLIDFIGLEEESWRIGLFKKECLRVIQDIQSRGKIPVLVGGTSYYVQSVLFNDALVGEGAENGVSDDNGQQSERQRKEGEEWAILDAPVGPMMEKLREVDPVMANRWHINEVRKIRRSLEIYLQTGRPASEIYEEQMRLRQAAIDNPEGIVAGQLRFQTLVFWVHSEREKLYRRLENRVDTMSEQGLIAEAQSLSEYAQEQAAQGKQIDLSRGIWVSIGYKEMEPYFTALRAGNYSEDDLKNLKQSCLECVKTSTRQYSASQVKWIRNKLWTALADIGATNRLYVLDSTDPGAWDSCVTEPMERIVQAFLRSEQLPEAKTISKLAEEMLREREQNYTKGTIPPAQALKQMTCEMCKKTLMGQEQWDIHIHAASHRRAIKAAAKRARNMEWLRNHPPVEVINAQPP
ncbi:tRNA isopentenyltransferase, putative [Talaromyces stipitatus ATCC 10500]|uniref:tRNA dimethylallyltransferase n=1 Tax=Talaromyces stipitatus (strain ATCC 10500 / CBS 375.48 / QM 6759 / NRRL 1006) TaxID=441959 RepID=B8MSQ8_TALSN|nr:tRNA isopentenyltransferase, putative [Talaromyces stipitatus ATCC 10500]EED12516.1 tRNA isopentenyltransferase, putative [Talaromyces stipitatus ATCC 10500]